MLKKLSPVLDKVQNDVYSINIDYGVNIVFTSNIVSSRNIATSENRTPDEQSNRHGSQYRSPVPCMPEAESPIFMPEAESPNFYAGGGGAYFNVTSGNIGNPIDSPNREEHKMLVLLKKWVIDYPKTTLAITLMLTLGLFSFLPKVKQNPSPHLLGPDHPSRVNLEYVREAFTGAKQSLLVLLEMEASGSNPNDEKTIFNSQTLQRVQNLTQAFEEITLADESDVQELQAIASEVGGEAAERLQQLAAEGLDEFSWEVVEEVKEILTTQGNLTVDWETRLDRVINRTTPIIEVTSLANTDNILSEGDELLVDPIYEDVPTTAEALNRMRNEVTGNRLFRNGLWNDDLTQTGILVELSLKDEDTDSAHQLYQRIIQLVEQEFPGSERHFVAGSPVALSTLRITVQHDTGVLMPIVSVIVMIILGLTFRMITGILVPMLVVGFAVGGTMSLMGFFEVGIGSVTSALPVFLISIGVADGIHIFSEYRSNLISGLSKSEALSKMMDRLAVPIVFTSVTTAIGFYTLSLTEVVQIRDFGVFVAVGTLIAMIYSLIFIPALLRLLPTPKNITSQGESFIDIKLDQFLGGVTQFVMKQYVAIVAVMAVLAAIGAYGLTLVEVDSNVVSFFDEDTPLVISSHKSNEFSGTDTLNLLIRSEDGAEPLKQPHHLQALEQLEAHLNQQPEVGRVTSIASLLQRIHYVMNDSDPDYDRVPQTREITNSGKTTVDGAHLAAQLLLLYENGGGDILTDVINSDYTHANMSVVLKTNSGWEQAQFVKRLRTYLAQNMPNTLHFEMGGPVAVSISITEEVVLGQLRSLAWSFGVIFLILCVVLRSIQRGIFGVLPLVFTVLINFGIMGYFGIRLEIGTAIVSGIVIGIGVDFSIHYLSRLMHELRGGVRYEQAILQTMHHSGKAIVSNAIAVALGFLALLAADFIPVRMMGWMISMTLLISAVATLMLIPALMRLLQPKFLFAHSEPNFTTLAPSQA